MSPAASLATPSLASEGVAAVPPLGRGVRSLRVHLIGLVLLAIVPSITVSSLTAVQAIDAFSHRYEEGLLDTVEGLAATLDRDIGTYSAVLTTLAASADLDEGGNLESFHQRAKPVATALDTAIILRRLDGTQLENTVLPPGQSSQTPPDPDLLHATVATGHGGVTNAHPSFVFDHLMTSVYQPVVRNGRVISLLTIGLSPALISASVALHGQHDGRSAEVADGYGVVIGRSLTAVDQIGQTIPAWLPSGIAGHESGLLRGENVSHTPMIVAFARPSQAPEWVVMICEPITSYESSWRAPLAARLTASLLALALAVAAAAWLGRGLSQPLVALTAHAQASAYGAEPPAGEIPASSVSEFEALRASLSRADAVLRRRGAAERMALQEARTGHELLASVVNGTVDLIYVKDLDLCFVLANRAALGMGGVRREEWQVLGRRSLDMIPHMPALTEEALDREVIGSGEMRSMNVEWASVHDSHVAVAGPSSNVALAEGTQAVRRSGGLRIMALTKTPWREADGTICGVVTVARDVTRQRAAELRVASVQGELLRASRLSAMGAMASGLAHELNQPLAAATNFLNAAGRLLDRAAAANDVAANGAATGAATGAAIGAATGAPREPASGTASLESARNAVTEAAQQTLRAGTIVRRLRDFIGRGEAELASEDMADLIREACEVARVDGAGRQSRLEVDVPADVGPVLVDRTQMQQVLLNLIRNAGEALGDIPGGCIVVSARRNGAGEMTIAVADNGPGLAPDVATRLFQPFVSTKTNGMGIGLAICGTIVEGHGGRLTAGANPGGGAVFVIVLPPMDSPNES